jgi:post-segregation antitoxin (ccd killing protein)
VNAKSNVTVYLNEDLANLGKEMGLNLSKVCENALKTAINKLQGLNVQNNDEQQHVNAQNNDKWTGRDLNPRLPRCERGDHTRLIYRPTLT